MTRQIAHTPYLSRLSDLALSRKLGTGFRLKSIEPSNQTSGCRPTGGADPIVQGQSKRLVCQEEKL